MVRLGVAVVAVVVAAADLAGRVGFDIPGNGRCVYERL